MSDSEIEILAEELNNITITETFNNTIDNTMATLAAAKEIARTLKNFSGKSEHLEFFIASIDKFYDRYFTNTNDASLKEFIFASICSKIIDDAGDFLLCRPDLTTWPEIRNALRQKFGDRVNRQVLSQQLNFLAKTRNENMIDFIERIKILKTRICLKIISDQTLRQETKQALNEQTELTAVTVLMSNSPTDLRTILMFQNPQNLEDANAIVVNHSLLEQQINARSFVPKQNNQPTNKPQHNKNTQFYKYQQPSNFQSNFQPNFQNTTQNQRQSSSLTFPSQPINIQPRQIQHHFPTNRQVFGKPKDVFSKENSNKPSGNPTPMSTTSRIPSLQTRNSQRPTMHQNFNNFQRNPFTITELTHLQEDASASNETQENYYAEDQIQFDPETNEYYYTAEEFDNSQSEPTENENFLETCPETIPP